MSSTTFLWIPLGEVKNGFCLPQLTSATDGTLYVWSRIVTGVLWRSLFHFHHSEFWLRFWRHVIPRLDHMSINVSGQDSSSFFWLLCYREFYLSQLDLIVFNAYSLPFWNFYHFSALFHWHLFIEILPVTLCIESDMCWKHEWNNNKQSFSRTALYIIPSPFDDILHSSGR